MATRPQLRLAHLAPLQGPHHQATPAPKQQRLPTADCRLRLAKDYSFGGARLGGGVGAGRGGLGGLLLLLLLTT